MRTIGQPRVPAKAALLLSCLLLACRPSGDPADPATDAQADAAAPTGDMTLGDAAQVDAAPNEGIADDSDSLNQSAGEVLDSDAATDDTQPGDASPPDLTAADVPPAGPDAAVDAGDSAQDADAAADSADASPTAAVCALGAYGPPLTNLGLNKPPLPGVAVAFGPAGQAVVLELNNGKPQEFITWVAPAGTIDLVAIVGQANTYVPYPPYNLLARAVDGGALLAGTTDTWEGAQGVLQVRDATGVIVASAVAKLPFGNVATAVAQAPSGEVALALMVVGDGEYSGFLLNEKPRILFLAADGVTQTTVGYPDGQTTGAITALAPMPGGFVSGGFHFVVFEPGSWSSWVQRLDTAGKVVWAHHTPEHLTYSAVKPLPTGGVLAGTGATENTATNTAKLRRFDDKGQLVWSVDLLAELAEVRAIAPDLTGAYVAGTTQTSYFSSGTGIPSAAWLARVDAAGHLQWLRTLAGASASLLTDVVAVGGGVRLGGYLYASPKAAPANLLALDAWGHADCGSAGLCAKLPLGACDDGDPLTADDCLGASGCVHTGL